MKHYPSIPRDFRKFDAYIFDKVDGSNIRAEWERNRGWYKFGARNRLVDETDPLLGKAKELFLRDWSEPLTRIARDNRWESLVAFLEYVGEKSFAGLHEADDPTVRLVLFDLAPHKKGILGPREYLDLCEHLPIAKFLGRAKWTRGFIERVRIGDFPGITFEGVVGKAGESHNQIRCKAKTQVWIDKVKLRYGLEADRILNS